MLAPKLHIALLTIFIRSVVSEEISIYSYQNALDERIIDRIADECHVASDWAASQSSLKYGKKTTFWMDINDQVKPRFFIEEAISQLYGLIPPSLTYNTSIVGAEWWIQTTRVDQG